VTLEGGQVVFELTGLEPATSYPLRVTSYDEEGNESEGVVNPGVTLLPNPASLTAEPYSGKVDLAWEAAQPGDLVKHYRIYASASDFTSVNGMVPKATVSSGTHSASVAGLSNGSPYYFAVTAVNLSGGENMRVDSVEATPTDDAEGPDVVRITYFDGEQEYELTDGATLTKNGSIRVYAEDPSGLSRLELEENGKGLGSDFTANPAFELPWNLTGIDDGPYQLTGMVYDTLNNSSEISVSVEVALEPPLSPELTSPETGVVTNQPEIMVQGQSVPTADIKVMINGSEHPETFSANAQGRFSANVPLVDGENTITVKAAYSNRGAYGPDSSSVTVVLDRTAPDAPQGLAAISKPLGQVALSWSSVENAAGYHIYREQGAFTDIRQATRITSTPIRNTYHQDLPVDDGDYFYRVVSVNELGTESEPSQSARATSDSTAPQALEIRYTPKGNHDPDSGRTGPGQVDIEITFSEPLKTTPYLAFTVSGGMPMVAELRRSYSDETLYTGAFTIKDTSVSGTAMAVLSAHDEVGNRGTDVLEGKTLIVDTQGPEVASLQLNPSAPIKN